jgi:hypothetical protein
MALLRGAVRLLGLRSPTEIKIIEHILGDGRDLRWTMYKRRNMAEEVGGIIGTHPGVAKRSLRSLVARGWLRRGVDIEGDSYLQLTPTFVLSAVLADQRMRIRRAIGPVEWQKLNGDDEMADKLHELAATMTQSKYKARVRAAVKMYIIAARVATEPGNKVFPAREQGVPGEGTPCARRGLTLIRGKGA